MIEYFKICRVGHWLKNIFILFGHVVALVLSPGLILNALLSLAPACLIASSYYILNEILDAPFDALHPAKLLANPLIIATTILTGAISVWLPYAQKHDWFNCKDALHLMEARWEKMHR